MNTDIRISLDFPTHRKTLKLVRRLGDGAPWVLVRLWIYVARHLPDGELIGMDEEDIEIAAGWQGENGAFVKALLDVGYLDQDDGGTISCHDWLEHNPWVAEANDRSDASRFSKLSQVSRAMFEELQAAGVRGLSKRDYETAKRAALAGKRLADISNSLAISSDAERIASDSIAPAPSPVPSPSPLPESKPTATTARATVTRQFEECFQEHEQKLRQLFPHADYAAERELCVAHYRDGPVHLDPWVVVLKWFNRIKKPDGGGNGNGTGRGRAGRSGAVVGKAPGVTPANGPEADWLGGSQFAPAHCPTLPD
jgi:hypothetical protein